MMLKNQYKDMKIFFEIEMSNVNINPVFLRGFINSHSIKILLGNLLGNLLGKY